MVELNNEYTQILIDVWWLRKIFIDVSFNESFEQLHKNLKNKRIFFAKTKKKKNLQLKYEYE